MTSATVPAIAAASPSPATSHTQSSALDSWGCALALAALGTAVLWKSSVGINWPLWTAGVVTALLLGARDRFGDAGAPARAAGAWAIALSLCTAITSDDVRIAVLVLGTVLLLAVALVAAGHRSLDVLHLRTAFLAPFLALALTIFGLSAEITGGARNSKSPRASAITRTALITVPLVVVLILLLGEADPLFAAIRDGLKHLVPDDVVAQLLFFVFLLVVTLGAFGSVQLGQTHVHAADQSMKRTLGYLERRVLMASLAAIMWMFVVSAAISLTRDPASMAGSGITYAEYVHSGFAQLSLAASLVIAVVLVTRRSWLANDEIARKLALAAVAGVGGMVIIAFMRVVGYEHVYGFTTLRIYAQAYMVVLAGMCALLAVEISRREASPRFAYHSASTALAVAVCCVVWNSDGWIVRRNVDRYLASGKIDIYYLTAALSDDATPALVDSVRRLHEPARSMVVRFLRDKDARGSKRDPSWYAWNFRSSAGARAAHVFHANDIDGALGTRQSRYDSKE